MNIPQVPLKLVYYEYHDDDNNNRNSNRYASKFSRNARKIKLYKHNCVNYLMLTRRNGPSSLASFFTVDLARVS